MFLKDTQTIVCTILADHKDLSIQKLYDHATQRGLSISLPNFYKTIAKLIDEQVIVKKHTTLQLHGMRVQHTVMLADKIKAHYLQNDVINIEKIKPGQNQIFEASSLYELDIIRTDIFGELYAKNAGQEAYYYNSHPYHMLGMPDKEKTNLEELGKKMAKTYFVFGNTTFLDQYGADMLRMQGYDITCKDNTLFPSEGYCLNIFGDYMIEVHFPEAITQYFKMFFDTVKSADEFNVDMFANILKMKSACSLKLIHSPEHAEKFSKTIRSYFPRKK